MNVHLIPRANPREIAEHRLNEYLMRFAFGAGISLAAGLIGMKFGPLVGGVFLGFPAILPASLTLIEKKEGKQQAAIDSEGAILGAIAMVVFALVVALSVTSWGVTTTLLVALLGWLIVATALYALVAGIFGREPTPP
jgi:hypothetical protein